MRTSRLSPARSTKTNGIVKITAISRQAEAVVDIPTIANILGEHQVQMIAIVKVTTAKAVMNNARVMDILIVQICTPVVEPPAVPRSSWVAPTTPLTSVANNPIGI